MARLDAAAEKVFGPDPRDSLRDSVDEICAVVSFRHEVPTVRCFDARGKTLLDHIFARHRLFDYFSIYHGSSSGRLFFVFACHDLGWLGRP